MNLPGLLVLDPNSDDFKPEESDKRFNLDLVVQMPHIELKHGEKTYVKYFTSDEFIILLKDKLLNWVDLVSSLLTIHSPKT